MSSVTRFLRQIPTGLAYYTASAQTQFYEFVPAPGNYVGNYPPGYVQLVNPAITFDPTSMILRDMGKTIKTIVGVAGTTLGFYREFQILQPLNLASTNGVGGAPTVPSQYAPYYTVYLPVTVSGVGLTPSGLVPVAGGQM
jgi:hypothetical protein